MGSLRRNPNWSSSRSTSTSKSEVETPRPIPKPKYNVFISYNHKDLFAMRSVKASLEGYGITVTVDIEKLETGSSINAFIEKSLKENYFILSIISKDSLLSGWVNKELTAGILLNKLGKSRWLPVRIDNACFDPEFFFSANETIDKKISELQSNMRKALDLGHHPTSFFEEYNRTVDLKSSFSETIQILKEVLVTNISGEFFDIGMLKVAGVIKNGG